MRLSCGGVVAMSCIILMCVVVANGVEVDLTKHVDDFVADMEKERTAGDHGTHGSHVDGEHRHHSSHGSHSHEGHMMKMWFHGGLEEVILFDFWRTDSVMDMILSCAAIFIMGATYEGVKWVRVYLQMSHSFSSIANRSCAEIALHTTNYTGRSGHNGLSRNSSHSLSKSASLAVQQHEPFLTHSTTIVRKNLGPFAPFRLAQTALYILQLVLAYWIMLIVMTYNTYLVVSVVLGAGFGHWLFAVLQLRTPDGESADSFAADACH